MCVASVATNTAQTRARTTQKHASVATQSENTWSAVIFVRTTKVGLVEPFATSFDCQIVVAEKFLPSRAHSHFGRGAPVVASPPCPSRVQTRPPPAAVCPQEFPPLPLTMVNRTEFQKAMNGLREEMKVSMTAFRKTFSKEVDSRIHCALAQACDQISADETNTLTKGPMRKLRALVQNDILSMR